MHGRRTIVDYEEGRRKLEIPNASWNFPDYIKNFSPEELIVETGNHIRTVVQHYRGVFKYYWFSEPTWQFCKIGEPLCLTHDQWVEMGRMVFDMVH